MNFADFGYRKIKAISPKLNLGDPLKNAKEIINLSKDSFISLYPELSLTGYSIGDLLQFEDTLEKCKKAVINILAETKTNKSLIVFGLPYEFKGKLYNVALAIKEGKILAMVPKSYLPNYAEFEEMRFFSSGKDVNEKIKDFNQEFSFSPNQIINISNTRIGIEICEDLWSPIPPSSKLSLAGCEIILNLSASNELVGKSKYRKELISNQSARTNSIYVYAGSNALESTRDILFGGHCLIYENGSLLKESERFKFDTSIIEADVDVNKIKLDRIKNITFGVDSLNYIENSLFKDQVYNLSKLNRTYSPHPFLSKNNEDLLEILEIQSTALARKLLSSNLEKIVLGLSGGLDSSLASLVSIKALEKLNLPSENLITVSMPGFGSSSRTKNQSDNLAKVLKSTHLVIDITKATKQHLEDINHSLIDIVYENAQARERTKVLFDLANKYNAIVCGTGNLSENILGFCTYNGDSESSYNVNSSIPKTLVKSLINYFKEHNKNYTKVLEEILNTPISPELLPLKEDKIVQKSEDFLGPYEVHDFISFHFLRNRFTFKKILALLIKSFPNYTKNEIKKYMITFIKRFFSNHFKRTSAPEGIKVGSVSVSQRGDLRMASEMDIENLIKEIENE